MYTILLCLIEIHQLFFLEYGSVDMQLKECLIFEPKVAKLTLEDGQVIEVMIYTQNIIYICGSF